MQTPTDPASATRGFSLILFGSLFTAPPLLGLWKGVEGGAAGGMNDVYGLLFFIAVGIGILITGASMVRRARRAKRLRVRYPDQPWMHRADWANGKVRDGGRGQTLFIFVFAVCWNTISCVILFNFLGQEKISYGVEAIVISLFALIGVVTAVVALYRLLRWHKYGTSVFELAQVPGGVGGSLGGVVLIRAKLEPQNGFNVLLRCIHRRIVRRGKNKTIHAETIWEREQLQVEAQRNLGNLKVIQVHFIIPYECQPTQTISNKEDYYWELIVSAKTVGIDYKAVFCVPVYRTKESSPAVKDWVENLPKKEREALGLDIHSVEGVNLTQTFLGGECMNFKKPLSILGFHTGFAIMGMVMLGFISATWDKDIPKLFLGGFMVFAALILCASLWALITKVQLMLYPERVEVIRRVLGIKLAPRIILREQIQQITVTQSIKMSAEAYYDLVIHTQQGKKVYIPAKIHRRPRAEIARNYILNP